MLNDLLKGVNLYLIGMMGAGKTTVGQVLARLSAADSTPHSHYHFFDTDALIEQLANQSISQIFATDGEATFRDLETQVLAELSAYTHLVIATGGGIVLRQTNWSYLRHGIVVWLDVPLEQLQHRLTHDATRPLLLEQDPQQKLKTLLEQRHALYAQADLCITVRAEESPDDIADRILQALPRVLKSEPVVPPFNGSHDSATETAE